MKIDLKSHKFPSGFFESLFNSCPDGIVAYDLDTRITVWNTVMEVATGVPATKAIGQTPEKLFPFIEDSNAKAHYLGALHGKTSIAIRQHYKFLETGKSGLYDAVYSPLIDLQENIIGGTVIVRDVTENIRIERAKSETEAKLKDLLSNSHDAILTCDHQGTILSWNSRATHIFEYSESEILDQNLGIVLPEKYWLQFLPKHQSKSIALKDKVELSESLEFIAKRKSGSNLHVNVRLSNWHLDHQPFLTVVIQDLTDRVRTERIAEETQELYEALLGAQSDLNEGVAVVDTAVFKITYANQAFCQMLGYTFEELKSLPDILNLVAPSSRTMHRMRIERRIKSQNNSDHYETVLLTKNGEEIIIDMAVKAVETSHGMASISIVRNITARKKVEQALIASERQKGFIIDTALDIIITYNIKGEFVTVNPALEKILGYEAKSLIGISGFDFVHPEDRHIAEQTLLNLIRGKPEPHIELRVRNSKNIYVTMEASSAPIIDSGIVTGATSVVRDISNRKKQEMAIVDENARLQAIAGAIAEGLAFTEKGVIIDASDSFLNMFGYRVASEVIGMNGGDFAVEPYRSQIKDRLNNNEEKPFKFIGMKKDGTTFNCEVAAKIYNYRGRVCRVASIREVETFRDTLT